MEIRVPLSHFLDHLKSVKEKSRRWVNLDEVEFSLNNSSFDDSTVTYSPMREHYSLATSDQAAEYRQLQREQVKRARLSA